ncbi:MAG: nucleotidyltransferase domain-containing protein [Candidatus Bathyarchaeia archaeon]
MDSTLFPKEFGMLGYEILSKSFWNNLTCAIKKFLGCREGWDVCLIGSYARGDAYPLSDVDLAVFAGEEAKAKRTEVFHVDGKTMTVFWVSVPELAGANAVDFYSANIPFEAKLMIGRGRMLEKLRNEMRHKRVDLEATRKLIWRTAAARLMAALSDAAMDVGEGVRNMRACMAKARLYTMLFMEKADPWTLIPYSYKPKNMLESLVEGLCRSQTREELSAKILRLKPDELMAETFKEHAGIMAKAAENIVDYVGFSGEHVKNYACLYLAVEERVRSTLWHSCHPDG